MADPLRRTILAKLRGKKSKKGTTVGGCSVSTNGHREGKDKLLQRRDEQTQQAIIITEFSVVPDTMWDDESCFNVGFDRGLGLEKENTVVANSFTPCETYLHNNSRLGNVECSEDLSLRGRVNEELLGVSVQRETKPRWNERDEMMSFNRQEHNFAAEQRPESLGRHQEPKKLSMSIPRQYSSGDSIGFGTCGNHLNRVGCTEIGIVKLTYGQYPVSKNKDTLVSREEDVRSPFDGSELVPQSVHNQRLKEAFIDNKDASRSVETKYINNGTQSYPIHDPNKVEENILRNIESYGSSPDFSEYKVNNLQYPTFFPTELEICDVNAVNNSLPVREGVQRHNSLDSEDDDYYDNEILPFYESECQNLENSDGKNADQVKITNCDSAQETDRLRTQLKEAYYLLINAMHNISFDSQVVTNGFVDKASISSHSQDSVCSQSSAKVIVIDAWSAGEKHPQQVSDKNTLPLRSNKTHEPFLKNFIISKSFENLHTAKVRSLLQRSVSDGDIKYPQTHLCMETLASQTCVFCSYRDELNKVGVDGNKKRSIYDGFSSDNFQDNRDDSLLNESGSSANSLAGSSDYAEAQGNKQDFNGAQGVSAKSHGVTVNKMQEWMHKGRMLSSEMKQRIAGSSLRIHGPAHLRPGHEFSDRTKTSTQMISIQGSKSMAPCQGDQRSDLIENVHRSITARCNDFRSSHNAITVSKKRNWLQQSSGKSHALEDGLVAFGTEQEHGQVANPHNSSSEVHRLVPPSLHLYQSNAAVSRAQTAAKPRLSDPAQENEADDEGEIWYNPIPEDEEPELSHLSAVWLQGPQVAEHQASQMKPNNGDSGRVIGVSPSGLSGMEGHLSGPPSKASHTNTAHSMEPVQLHKQMFVCKVAEEIPVPRATAPDGIELSNSGFSPPSSPNPSKKGSSINWSFPDKIKSPRTVRKLSMKMKKLPELSRKLSVKGTPSSSQPEPQPPSSKASGVTEPGRGPLCTAPMPSQAAASRNVISRYHLDSSVSTYSKKKSGGSSKSCSKGGYLSDGDSPELVVKSGKHGSEGKTTKSKEPLASGSHKSHGTELDIDAFRHYSFSEQPKCAQYVSGLMNVHFYGAEDLKPPRVDSRDVYCAIQVDCVNKARTALLTCRTSFLDMDHTFNIELENAQHLKLVVFSWEPAPRRNRVCCHGTVALPMLFRVTRTHQLAVKLEPRGTIYVKLNLMEQWQNSLGRPDREREPEVFGVEAWRVVERESVGLMVPLLIEKCITEIEKRGCQVVGLYRLCGSAAVKKELREAFERDSRFVELSESQYPDINVITGVLKDYLRELPSPLITKHLYEAVLDSMAKRPLRIGANGCENEVEDSEHTVSLLENLPEVEKATLRKLLDHLKLVASFHVVNKMTCQNLAVCFGPVLLSQRQEASCHSNRVFIHSEELASALHFKKHIEVLHYLLQLWPVVDPHRTNSAPVKEPSVEVSVPPQYLRRRRDRPQVLNLSETEMAGVLRPKPGRLDSPSNRYAGDWSCCRENYLEPPKETASGEADYDDVPSEETEVTEDQNGQSDQVYPTVEEDRLDEREREVEEAGPSEDSTKNFLSSQEHLAKDHTYQAFIKIQDISPVLSDRVNLKDLQESIDTLIGNLERELNKNKFNVGY